MTLDIRVFSLFLAASAASIAAQASEAAAGSRDETLEQVTIEGTRYISELTVGGKTPINPRAIPNSVSVITERQMQDQNLVSVMDALSQVTGVTVVPNDVGDTSQYRSRGYSLAVMYDGVPAFNSISGVRQFDLAIYQRVEVLRGPGGVLQGSSEPGGTVNLVRKRGLEQFGLATTLTGGRWNNYRGVLDVTGPLNDSVRARAIGIYDKGDAFTDGTANLHRLGYATLDWDISGSTTLSLSVTAQNDRLQGAYGGLPTWENGDLLDVPRSTNPRGQPWQIFLTKIEDYEVGVAHRFGKGWLVRLSASRRDLGTFFHDAIPWSGVRPSDYTVPYVRREFDADSKRQAADLFLTGPVNLFGRTHSLLVGYNFESFDSRSVGLSLTSPQDEIRIPFDRLDLLPDYSLPYTRGSVTETEQDGFYAQGRFSLSDPLTIVAGVRSSDFRVRSRNVPPAVPTEWSAGNRADSEITPYGGIVYDLNAWLSLYASYSSIFIPQSTLLKSDRSPLDARTGRQYEVGSKADFFDRRLTASLAVFNLRDVNRSLSDVRNPGFYLNAGEVESKGWEMQLSGSPVAGYEVQAGYARGDNRYRVAAPNQQGLQLSLFEPRHSWKLWGVRRFNRPDQSGLTLGLGVNAQSGIRVEPNRAQGGYAVVSALVGYRFDPHVEVDLNLRNVFDKTYYPRLGGTNSYNTYGEPASFSLSLRATL